MWFHPLLTWIQHNYTQCLGRGLTSILCRALMCSYLCWVCCRTVLTLQCFVLVAHHLMIWQCTVVSVFHLQLMSSQLAMEINPWNLELSPCAVEFCLVFIIWSLFLSCSLRAVRYSSVFTHPNFLQLANSLTNSCFLCPGHSQKRKLFPKLALKEYK